MQLKPPKKYKTIYFDLDSTLWDFKTNSELTFRELIDKYFDPTDITFDKFCQIYYPINDALWASYRKGTLKKEVLRTKRFADTFKHFGIDNNNLINKFADEYLDICPTKTVVFDYTYQVLDYLKQKNYRLFLLTNGFREVQTVKIERSGLQKYFEKLICSEDAGYQKPHRKIFEYAIKTVNARKTESIMIGDDPQTDIIGANKFGIDCVFFNHQKTKHNFKVTHEIYSLKTLQNIL